MSWDQLLILAPNGQNSVGLSISEIHCRNYSYFFLQMFANDLTTTLLFGQKSLCFLLIRKIWKAPALADCLSRQQWTLTFLNQYLGALPPSPSEGLFLLTLSCAICYNNAWLFTQWHNSYHSDRHAMNAMSFSLLSGSLTWSNQFRRDWWCSVDTRRQ